MSAPGTVQDRRGPAQRLHDSVLRWLLLPAWLCYVPAVAARNALFTCGARRPKKLGVPVISVGNITVGGTGKTPVVQEVVNFARASGHKPVVLSRGYGGEGGANDEARMLDADVICDPNRFRAGTQAIARGCTCLVLDDGYQHRQLARDLNVVLIDALRPWGAAPAMQLPVGSLRECRSGLKRADAFVLTHCDEVDAGALAGLRQYLSRFAKPVFQARHQPTTLTALSGGTEQPLASLAGKAVVLACGIGNPASFERSARQLGWNVVESLRFPDHHRYGEAEWQGMIRRAGEKAATLVVTTKDAVKLAELSKQSGASTERCLVMRMRIAFDEADSTAFQTMLKSVLSVGTGR